MRMDVGATNVSTAGTAVQLSSDGGINATDRVLWARFKGVPGNSGIAYVGIADVSATQGWPLENDDVVGLTIDFGSMGGSVSAGDIYFDVATHNDDVAWALIIE
tara:strand:- start:522 stop:833 length:312 start_codon:yes stop_codon:yes gene_type:complete